MRRLLTIIALILLAGCGGGGGATLSPLPSSGAAPTPETSGPLTLALEVETAGDARRIVLSARDAVDLYQLAATLEYDASRYQLVEAVSGGGLGNAAESYFICEETAPGQLDFAYTRRYYGPGASGEVRLLEVVVNPLAEFALSDFSISDQPGALLARDGAKRELAVTAAGVRQ